MDEAQSFGDNPVIHCEHSAQVDPKMLRPHPANPNYHSDEQIALFINILKFSGWRRPITVSKRSNFITKGHGAREAALAAGFTIVPVDYQHYDSEAQEIADIIADNQLARMSQMSNVKLQDLIVTLDTGDFNLELTGLKMERIETLMTTVPGWSGAPPTAQPEGEELRVSEYANETQFSGGPAKDQPQIELWQSDIERSQKEVEGIEANTDGIIAVIKIHCPQPMAGSFKEQLKEFLEMVKDDFVGVALA